MITANANSPWWRLCLGNICCCWGDTPPHPVCASYSLQRRNRWLLVVLFNCLSTIYFVSANFPHQLPGTPWAFCERHRGRSTAPLLSSNAERRLSFVLVFKSFSSWNWNGCVHKTWPCQNLKWPPVCKFLACILPEASPPGRWAPCRTAWTPTLVQFWTAISLQKETYHWSSPEVFVFPHALVLCFGSCQDHVHILRAPGFSRCEIILCGQKCSSRL